MNAYIIVYKLDNSRDDYVNISRRIKAYSSWAKIFDRTWFIATDDDPKIIRDSLSTAINGKGEIMVIKITGRAWASYSVDKKITNWLKENL